VPDRREIPLRRRAAAPPHLGRSPMPAPISGSGDAARQPAREADQELPE
jgi:hypothetical protein